MNLEKLGKEVRKAKGDSLTVFFAAKTHKVDCPLRTIVTEKGTWQQQVGQHLERYLNTLVTSDPFAATSSDSVVDFLRERQPCANAAFSLGIEDLFYSVPHADFVAVRELIEENGAAPSNMRSFKKLPYVSIPSEPILPRWRTWLEAVQFYNCYFSDIKVTGSATLRKAQAVLTVGSLQGDLAYLCANVTFFANVIRKFERSGETLIANIAQVIHVQREIPAISEGPVAEKARAK
ncbi:hypothetical protein HPB52_001697 [Rhipicephalus sanguineus]|uniref:Uncharacterized protein n=1 Tax=Rhipicephalus sanguineus TaxID=34632 RepID=A0A9D4PC69_RHISA|nr:hypothetical protein HPB52_001697 [Rhipicephalus sanguineus]